MVQLDTDRLNEKPFELDLKLPPEILVSQVIEKIENLMAASFEEGFLKNCRERILFAIAVDELECWLLPLFYADKSASVTNNCLYKLNIQLAKQKQTTINPQAKNPKHYDQFSRPFCKIKTLRDAAAKNPSLGIFTRTLPSMA